MHLGNSLPELIFYSVRAVLLADECLPISRYVHAFWTVGNYNLLLC